MEGFEYYTMTDRRCQSWQGQKGDSDKCVGANKAGKDKKAMKKQGGPTRDLVRKVSTDDTDGKWAATLLTTQPSKGASSGCLACHSSCVSLAQILTPFRLSLIADCHSNNLPVTSNHQAALHWYKITSVLWSYGYSIPYNCHLSTYANQDIYLVLQRLDRSPKC